jgi:O-succinylbenzoate synthase
MSGSRGHNFAKVAAEGAYWHLLSLQKQEPLSKIWGGTLSRVEVGTRFGIEEIPILLQHIQDALDQGFKRIKIKIKPGFDVKPVAAIRERFGEIPLMVDANSGYTLSPEHLHLLKDLDQFGLIMIEQPLAHDDIIDHATLQRQLTNTPICLDESIHIFEDARKAIQIGACKIINIKPPRVGGFAVSKRIAKYAQEHGIGIWCGGMFETGIGKAFNTHLCTLDAFNLPGDSPDCRNYYEHDLLVEDDPIVIGKDARVVVPETPGLGN